MIIEKDSKRITDDIADQLIAYRKQLKLTQKDIADATGMKRANIARIELKKNEASLYKSGDIVRLSQNVPKWFSKIDV